MSPPVTLHVELVRVERDGYRVRMPNSGKPAAWVPRGDSVRLDSGRGDVVRLRVPAWLYARLAGQL